MSFHRRLNLISHSNLCHVETPDKITQPLNADCNIADAVSPM